VQAGHRHLPRTACCRPTLCSGDDGLNGDWDPRSLYSMCSVWEPQGGALGAWTVNKSPTFALPRCYSRDLPAQKCSKFAAALQIREFANCSVANLAR
jgi:hypothetical protein